MNPLEHIEEDRIVEEKLLKTLLDFIRHASAYQEQLYVTSTQNQTQSNDFGIQFTYMLLENLRNCLKSVMVAFLDKQQLRNALLSSRHRAEIMHIIVQVGDKICNSNNVDKIASNEWIQRRETFMSMLDN